MKKRSTLLIFLIIVLLVLPIFVYAKTEKISNSIISKEDNQIIRVVVHLKEDSNLNKRSVQSLSGSIVSSEKINYQSKNNIFASLTKKEIEQLAQLENVESITEEKKYQIFLQDSVPLINATVSWNLQSVGFNLTGQGQTICIIDTGVNYSHSDLGGCFGENNISSTCKIIGGWDFCSDDTDCLNSEDSNPMDVQGHGTHVSGIASANGSINGVAPFSKIIMIKAANATGTLWDAEIKKSIDWCVNNASKFNISVISMSFGGWMYDNYCDWDDSEGLVSSINAAIAKNISVIAASGNENNYTHISSPACIQNVTPVGNIWKTDEVYNSFSRNFMVKLLAPGVDINSTTINGRYSGNTWNGTSMSTPHVAGAIAIINQYLKSINKTKTPSEIEDLLNATGKQIYDSYATRFFSRIDIYSALMEIDETSPNVTLSSPINGSVNISQNKTFICNSSDWQLKNISLYLWNNTGLYYNSSKEISGISNSTEFNVTEISYGEYTWNCLASDENGYSAFAQNNFSFFNEGITLSLISPMNNTYTNLNETTFNCSAITSQDRQIKNISFFVFENGTQTNLTNLNLTGNTNSSLFNFTFVNETNYTWGCKVYSNDSNYTAKNYTIYYDSTTPSLVSLTELSTTSEVTITWNTDEETNYSVTLQDQRNSSFSQNHVLILSGLIASTAYNYNLTYCDRAGNCNVTSRSFRTGDNLVVSSGGGGGGSTVVSLTESQIVGGISKKFSIGEKVNLVINAQNHSMQLNKIINNTANITLRSEPINLNISSGEERKINLTSNEYYDLYIKVENVTKNSANITLKKINELITPINLIETNATGRGKQYEIFNENPGKKVLDLAPLYATIFLLGTFIIYFLIRKNFWNTKKKVKKSKFL